jgi:hypothetical protein
MKLFLLFPALAFCFNMIYSGKGCRDCLSNSTNIAYNNTVCTSNYNKGVAYCCSEPDFKKNRACISSPLCSRDISDSNMWGVVCPHEKWSCGRKTPDIVLAMN